MTGSSSQKQIDDYIGSKLDAIRANYRATGDAETSLLAAESLIKDFDGVPAAKGSVQLAKALTFVCDLRLSNASSIADLEVVKSNAEKGIEILYSSDNKSPMVVQSLASANLYLAVALKAGNRKDDAFDTIKRAKSEMRRFFDTNYIEEVLLTRQEILMQEEESGFSKLLDLVPDYIDKVPHEAYASIKRVFEFALNRNQASLAGNLLPALNETFRISSSRLGPLAKISYQKNLGHYYLCVGELNSAERILDVALRQAIALGYHGQAKQISALLEKVRDGGVGSLGTFKID